MSAELTVAYDGEPIGHLVEEDTGGWAFVYRPEFLAQYPGGRTVSLNFPPRTHAYRGPELTALFRNLLPGGAIRRQLCQRLGISEGNDFGLLGALGGDCPGALTLTRPAEEVRPRASVVRLFSEQELRHVVAALPRQPLLSDVEGARFCLPGERDKFPVRVEKDRLGVALGDILSSHIVKPGRADLRESVMNEAFCLELAQASGLVTVDASVRHGAVTVLLVERVDRVARDGSWSAVHMEDLCQLMGVPPESKFEREGGLSFADCLDAIRRYSCMPAIDMRAFLRWVMMCYFIGDGAGHAKQLAMLHHADGPRLAPFYGLMSTHVYPELNRRLAMRIGGEDRPDWLLPARWRAAAQTAGIRSSYVLELLRDMAGSLPALAGSVAEDFQRRNGFATVIRDIRRLIEQRARQVIVALEAELA
ncbi:MAG: HipA domain-containing protein [Gammaproteobacteria bacterium]|jgi:serine/threonine-protein kinase HipA